MNKLTQNQILTIESMITDLETDKAVSKNQVLSLEAAVGINVITEKVPLGMLSEYKTGTNYDNVLNILKSSIKDVEITDIITVNDAVALGERYNKVIKKYAILFDMLVNTRPEVLDHMTNKQYTYTWDSDALIDIADTPFFALFNGYTDYVNSLCNVTTTNGNVFDSVMKLYTNMMTSSETEILSLPIVLGSLLDFDNFKRNLTTGNLFCKKCFTLRDMKTIITNSASIAKLLKELTVEFNPNSISLRGIALDINYCDGGNNYFYRNNVSDTEYADERLGSSYTILNNITNLLENDIESLTILQMFTLFLR